MFKAIRISILLFVLFFVAVSTWLTQARSTDWNNSLWVKVYPINGDDTAASGKYIEGLRLSDFKSIESFLERETGKYAASLDRPVRIELGQAIDEQPPELGGETGALSVMLWSLKMRWWAGSITDDQDRIEPDVRMFVRYHTPDATISLENSVGLQKGMVGIVNGYASRRYRETNNVIIAHEFLHTLGATDKYDPGTGQPIGPDGLAEPDRKPLYPQQYAEIMGGRIALADDDAMIPKSLRHTVIGPLTAREINLID
ncbi:MAG: hypothetical protein KJO95_00455 [Gammaproteobacteria bacterium]|nr:hypothetical protein [Gammaproteobacteria bacterium]MBU2678325.1 hypothetical protein [Gammaproteobacteria bacterium]NNC56128.1 hypothetical protein [Woeseiaceae bacterium]NNL52060.1 hypothetical protein [Woeseiaceae bacterium]